MSADPGRRKVTAALLSAAAVLAAGVAGCGQANTYHEPPPPEVTVIKPVRRAVTSYFEYTGTTQAVEKVELRARVKGFLKKKLFQGGADVKAGQLLMVIDEEPFQVRLELARAKQAEAEAALKKAEESQGRQVAQAQLDLDQAQLDLSKIEEARNRSLLTRNAGSREDVDRAEATRKKTEAQVESDRASLKQSRADYEINILAAQSSLRAARADVRDAELNLSYCRVTAPIDGRITKTELDVGNYVGDGQATVLATIYKTEPIHVYINVSEDDMLRAQRMVRQGKRKDYRTSPIPMEMGLGDEEGYPHAGQADYIDPSVDTGTGTVRTRGLFPNPGGSITPGLFVRVRLPFERRDNALLVPDRALGADQGGAFLLVVVAGDKVERRPVRPGTEVGELRVVDGKLGPDDRVVLDGLLRARPGMKVTPRPAEPTPPPQAVAEARTTRP